LQNKERKNNMKNIGKFEALESFKRKKQKRRWRERGTRGMYIGQKEMGH
jgi:hypothetical protein